MDASPTSLHLKVRAKIADGYLPKEFLPRVFGGPGTGQRCDACEETPLPEDLESEANLAKGGLVRFHIRCFGIWQTERVAQDQPPTNTT